MPARHLVPRLSLRAALALVTALSPVACSDLALQPDRVPDELILEPSDTLITQGDRAQLRVTVLDQDGRPFAELPSWAPPDWSASRPDAVAFQGDGTMEALGGGEIDVEARLAGLWARSTVRINPNQVVLGAPIVYLAQAAQNLAGDVPIVAGRTAMLRVFVTSTPGSFYQPRGRAAFYLNGDLTYQTLLLPGSYLIPEGVDESRLERSFNALIPGDVLQPGVELVVELDVDGVVPLASGSQMRVPEAGTMSLDVRDLPPLALTVVPTLLSQSPDESILSWAGSLAETTGAIRFLRTVLPIGELELEVHEPYTTSADLTTEDGWSQFLREVDVLRTAEGSQGYYYGAVVLPSGSPYGGLGYVGRPASVGRPTESTLAHEVGHNLSLRHAPCGGVSSSDPDFPYGGGVIGVWGYSNLGGSGLGTLRDPQQTKDLMGYCSPRWISDYHFVKALQFREDEEFLPGVSGEPEPVLLLWGGIQDGVLELEPAFALVAPPALPEESGPYLLEGTAADGRTLFSLRFDVNEVSRGGGHFSFAVPLDAGALETLDAVALVGPEGVTTLDRATRRPPVALVRDGATGRIRGILRGDAVSAADPSDGPMTTSRGLPGSGRTGGAR